MSYLAAVRIEARGLDDDVAEEIADIAARAEAEVRSHLPTLSDGITLCVKTGEFVIPETGEVGASVSPGRVEWMVDPASPGGILGVARRHLRESLFHELHHQVRGWVMTGGPRVKSFMVAVVAEGLATAFARDAAGEDAPWAKYPDDVAAWVHELTGLRRTANYSHWMYLHPDGRRWIGYRAGTYIADRAIQASGLSAAELVHAPTTDILRLAEAAA